MTRLNIPLFVALAASLLSAIDARDQLPHQRMIRKRGPAPLGQFEERAAAFVVPRWPGLVERQAAPSGSASVSVSATKPAASNSASASSVRESSTSAQSSSAAVTPSSSSASAQNTLSASSSSGGLLDSLTAVLGGSQSSTSASSTTSSSASSSSVVSSSAVPSSSSSVVPSTSQAASATPVAQPSPSLNLATTPAPTAASNPSQSVAVVYSTAAAAPEAQQSAAAQKARTITKNTIISLVVIASCIGGAIAIWTVIRKWKLAPSERFDDRMQPIDWAPTGGASGVRDDPLAEKTSHRRVGSTGSHGSFTSGGVGQSELGHGGAKSIYSDATGHGNGNAQYGAQAQDFPPPHDFTAGTAPGAYGQYQGQQYAGAGYADLRRGPSVTESNYSHGTYSRGPAYEAQPGAAGVPPLPNPYGGYEEEYYQPAQGHTQPQGQGQYRGY